MKKKAKASRPRSAKRDLPARKADGVKGGVVTSSAVSLPYIEQGAGPHVKVLDSRSAP
jgi:hypothetical protein